MRVCEYYNTIWLARYQKETHVNFGLFTDNYMNISEISFNTDFPAKDVRYIDFNLCWKLVFLI